MEINVSWLRCHIYKSTFGGAHAYIGVVHVVVKHVLVVVCVYERQ